MSDANPGFADALMVPKSLVAGGDLAAKLTAIKAIATPLMGLKDGERVDVPIPSPGPSYFVRRYSAKGPMDTIGFPNDHPRNGHPRFRWVEGPNGVKLGHREPDVDPGN